MACTFAPDSAAGVLTPRHDKRPTIIVKPKGPQGAHGAPWIFSNEIVMDAAAKALAPGALVNVKGDDGQDIGTGYFNVQSLIAVRLLARECGARD